MDKLHFNNRSLLVADEHTVKVLTVAGKAARSNAPVLIYGESGTGKELVARYIHEKSPRCQKAFVSVNCAAIPDGLLESELFGFERGAFTGAISQRIGKFERAHQGTILLDELSEMPMALQAKLLRVLQEGEVDRLGGMRSVSIDTRVIATTNKDPLLLIREGKFREDLYYRLNVARIDVLPLRGRLKAISNLTQAFLKKAGDLHGVATPPTLTAEAMQKLIQYTWPGNIRELQNSIERAVLLSENPVLDIEDFDFIDQAANANASQMSLEVIEREHIYKVLTQASGNRTHAAEILGISVRTLRNKLKLYG